MNCKTCKRCCHGSSQGTYISERELEKQPDLKAKRISDKFYEIPTINKRCIYLKKNGCELKRKPLACVIYPFFPTNKGWILKTDCYHWFKMGKKELNRIKKMFVKRKDEWVGEL